MTPPQILLRPHLERRLSASGVSLESTLEDGGASIARAGDPERLEAVVVLRAFDLPAYAAAAVAFSAALAPDLRRAWYREFTRTTFLAGDPRRLRARFSFDHVTGEGAVAFVAPRPSREQATLRRLLKPLRTRDPIRHDSLPQFPATGTPRRLRLDAACGGLKLEELLVHLNHCLCESAIEGHLGAGEVPAVRLVPEIDELPEPALHVRVRPAPGDPGSLRLYAVLGEDR